MTFRNPGLSIDTRHARHSATSKKVLLKSSSTGKIQQLSGSDHAKSQNSEQSYKSLLCAANIYRRQNNMSKAIDTFNKLLQIKPGTLLIYIYLGKALESSERSTEAYNVYKEAIFTNSNNPKAYDIMADFCIKQHKLDEAMVLVEQALKLDRTNWNLNHKKCKILEMMGQYDRVAQHTGKLLSEHNIQGTCVQLRIMHIEASFRQWKANHGAWNELDQLIKSVNSLSDVAPKNVRCKLLLSELLIARDRHEDAFMVMQDTLELDPESDLVHQRLIEILDVVDVNTPEVCDR